MTMQFPGDVPAAFAANGHDAAAAADLFKRACLDTSLAREAAGKVAEASGWGFVYRPVTIPFKNPVDMGGWYARDAAVNVGSGMFFNKHSQCNLIVVLAGEFSVAKMRDALGSAIGSPPSNSADAVDKKGKPKKYFVPEWQVQVASGTPATVKVMAVVGSDGSIQLSALQKVSK